MGILGRIKRKWLRFKIKFRETLSVKHVLSAEQKKACKIAKRLIIDKQSKLYCSASSVYGENFKPRYIIQNGHVFVRITHDKIRIINGKYKYDVSFSEGDSSLAEVKIFFEKNMEHRIDKLEEEINLKVEKSLDIIFDEIVSNDSKGELSENPEAEENIKNFLMHKKT
jgi:hypothetical protein